MRIGSVYPTFIYNTNHVSSRSLGRINAIPNDVLQSKVGYTTSETANPLRRGTSRDFAGIFASQMAMSRMHAARIMKQPAAETAAAQPDKVQSLSLHEEQNIQPEEIDIQGIVNDMAVSEA